MGLVRTMVGTLAAAVGPGAGWGCTPIGAWQYEDPTVEVAAARITDPGGAVTDVELQLRNPNDYPVTLVAYVVEVRVGSAAGSTEVTGQQVRVPTRDGARFTVRVAPDSAGAARADQPTGAPVRINGDVRMDTPIGVRRVRFAASGRTRNREQDGLAPVALDRPVLRVVPKDERPTRTGETVQP